MFIKFVSIRSRGHFVIYAKDKRLNVVSWSRHIIQYIYDISLVWYVLFIYSEFQIHICVLKVRVFIGTNLTNFPSLFCSEFLYWENVLIFCSINQNSLKTESKIRIDVLNHDKSHGKVLFSLHEYQISVSFASLCTGCIFCQPYRFPNLAKICTAREHIYYIYTETLKCHAVSPNN